MDKFDRILNELNDSVDSRVRKFAKDLEGVLSRIEELIVDVSVEFNRTPDIAYNIELALNDSGYYRLVDDFITNNYDESYELLVALCQASGLGSLVFTQEDLLSLNSIKAMDMRWFRDIGNDAKNTLVRDLTRYSITNMSSSEMIKNMRESLKGTNLYRYSETYVDTAISKFNQQAMDILTSDIDDTVAIYGNIRDSKNRPLCACLLAKKHYYNDKDANRIRSDKRRAYNCRHLVFNVSLEYALDSGYTKGSFSC